MREILFRGESLRTEKWIQGYLFRCWERAYIAWGMWNDNADMKEVDPETVCQYTGLTDKNGRKIFEGDIVKTSQYGVDDGNGHNYAGFATFSVEFSDGSFCLKNKWRRFNLRPQRDFEVIGNIFDNPELVEK